MNQTNQYQMTRNWKHKESQIEQNLLSSGFILPQNVEMEKSVLGAMMFSREIADEVFELIQSPEIFYKESHKEIFQSMQNIRDYGQTIDLLTVIEDLTQRNKLEFVGGNFEIVSLSSLRPDYKIDSHTKILIEKWVLREAIKLGQTIISNASKPDADPFDIVEEINSEVEKISFKNISKGMTSLDNLLIETLTKIEEERKITSDIVGLTSGINKIDAEFHGWQAPDLIILAARPSVGKTALALNFAYAASQISPVAFFSYEMSNEQIARRLLSIDTLVPYREVRFPNHMGDINWKKVQQVPGLSKRTILCKDDRNINTTQMLAMCRRIKKKQGLGLIIVDYLQLMPEDRRKDSNREQQIARISRDLKGMAKDLNVPVIALSQMSRDIEQNGGGSREPRLSDLRESGAIEQDADIVTFLYGPTENEIKENASLENEAYLKIAKHRGGDLKKILLYKDLGTQRFLDEQPFEDSFNQPFNPNAGIKQDYNREPDFGKPNDFTPF